MKKKNAFKFVFWMTVLFFASPLIFAGTYGGGSGTENQPYQIASPDNWQELMTTPDDWGNHFILMAEVNLAEVTLMPVGNNDTTFIGVFDGNNNIISNAVINQPESDYIGLFGYVGPGGQIHNLDIENVNMTGNIYTGGLVGVNLGDTLTSCYLTGSVNGTENVGGLVGFNSSCSLTDCTVDASVTGTGKVGGLVGRSLSGAVLNDCSASGSVSGSGNVGGLVGLNSGTIAACYSTVSVVDRVSGTAGGLVGTNSGTITACYSTGSVSSPIGYSTFGGLVGINSGAITACYSTGVVSGRDIGGGLVGRNQVGGIIASCYSTSSVLGRPLYCVCVGGLVGVNSGTIIACYSTGSVSASSCSSEGGLVGSHKDESIFMACFWDMQTSGQTNGVGNENPDPSGVTGKTTEEMKTLSTFTGAGWDFAYIWGILDGNYPYLLEHEPHTLHLQTSPSFITSINPPAGEHTVYFSVDISATDFSQCPDMYVFDYWEGDVEDPNSASTRVFMNEDKTVTAVFSDNRQCGDQCHPYPPMDFNQDCLVDFEDFAQFASNWMACTKPECD